MKFRRHIAVGWCTTLAMSSALVLGTPQIGRAGLLSVAENLPNTGFRTSFTLGAGANTPLAAGQSYSVTIPNFTTPDGRFEFIISNISAANPNGFPSISGTMSIFDVNGGQGSVFLDFRQFYVPNAIFNNGCFDGAALVGTFTEAAPHGNNVVGVGFVGGAALPPLAATDFDGGAFNVNTGFFFLPRPNEFEGQVTFNFAAGAQAGDGISLPFSIEAPSLTAVPEPGSWFMISTGVLGGLAYWSFRQRGAAT